MFHRIFWSLIIKLASQRSCLHGFWSGRTSPEDIQARDGMSRVFPSWHIEPCIFFQSFRGFYCLHLDNLGLTVDSKHLHVCSSPATGVDLLSLDGRLAVRCSATALPHREVKRFLRMARWVYKARSGGHGVIQRVGPRCSCWFTS